VSTSASLDQVELGIHFVGAVDGDVDLPGTSSGRSGMPSLSASSRLDSDVGTPRYARPARTSAPTSAMKSLAVDPDPSPKTPLSGRSAAALRAAGGSLRFLAVTRARLSSSARQVLSSGITRGRPPPCHGPRPSKGSSAQARCALPIDQDDPRSRRRDGRGAR
jgi:hypothetical protein